MRIHTSDARKTGPSGKRRFEAALAGFEHRADVWVTWRSFELAPEVRDDEVVTGGASCGVDGC